MHLKTLQMQSDDPNDGILRIKLTYVQVNDNTNLNGSVVVLSRNRLVCKTSKSKTDVRDKWSSRVGNSLDLYHCARVGHLKRQSMARVESQSVSDVNAGYMHYTNNQH